MTQPAENTVETQVAVGLATGSPVTGSLATDDVRETGPQRTCIVTRELRDKAAMIRFVAGPDGWIVPDLKGDLPGRGYWVTADSGVLAAGLKRQVFAKVSRGQAKAAPDLVDRVARLLERQLLDQLGLAKKSGHLVAGFEKVETALRSGRVRLLIEASDGSADGRGKLARLAQSGVAAGSGVEIWAPLPGDALAPAVGRFTAVHLAVRSGGLADRLATTLRRHAGFTGAGSTKAGSTKAGPTGAGSTGAGSTGAGSTSARPGGDADTSDRS